MSEITTVRLDLAKNVFQAHGAEAPLIAATSRQVRANDWFRGGSVGIMLRPQQTAFRPARRRRRSDERGSSAPSERPRCQYS